MIAIHAMGPKAIPVLLETLGRTNLGIGRNAVELLDRLGPLEQNTITALVRRMLARESSGHQFYRAVWNAVPAGASRWLPKPNVPQPWARRYLDYWFRQAQLPYAVFLGKLESAQFRQTIHPEAIDPFRHQLPLLNAALHDPIDWVSEQAAVALRKMGLDARESIPQLIHELQNTKRVPEVRATVACALGRIGPGSPEAVMALVRATSSPDRTVQCGAIVGLGGGGGFDENETVATLRQLNYSAKQLVTNRLREIWKGNDALMAYLAYESLCNVDPDGVKGTTKPQPIASERNDGILAFNSPGSDYSLFIRFRRR